MVKKAAAKKNPPPSPKKRTVDKSADTGRFVSEKDLKAHPKTTYKQSVIIQPKKKS